MGLLINGGIFAYFINTFLEIYSQYQHDSPDGGQIVCDAESRSLAVIILYFATIANFLVEVPREIKYANLLVSGRSHI